MRCSHNVSLVSWSGELHVWCLLVTFPLTPCHVSQRNQLLPCLKLFCCSICLLSRQALLHGSHYSQFNYSFQFFSLHPTKFMSLYVHVNTNAAGFYLRFCTDKLKVLSIEFMRRTSNWKTPRCVKSSYVKIMWICVLTIDAKTNNCRSITVSGSLGSAGQPQCTTDRRLPTTCSKSIKHSHTMCIHAACCTMRWWVCNYATVHQ